MLVDSLPDSGSLAPIAVPTGPSHETKCPRSFPYLALVMLFDAGPSTTSNGWTATVIRLPHILIRAHNDSRRTPWVGTLT